MCLLPSQGQRLHALLGRGRMASLARVPPTAAGRLLQLGMQHRKQTPCRAKSASSWGMEPITAET